MRRNALVHLKVPHSLGVVQIATATPSDALWIEHLQRKFSNDLGFVPRAGIRGLLDRRNYLRIDLDGKDAGFVLVTGGITKPVRISQIAIDEQLWRNGIGAIAIALIRKKALLMRKPDVVATTRDGLIANIVAIETGATHLATTLIAHARKKRSHLYLWSHLCVGKPPQERDNSGAIGTVDTYLRKGIAATGGRKENRMAASRSH